LYFLFKMSKPRVLVLGGNGFIGKNLVQYLVEKDLCSKIRVADKVLPSFAGLTKKQDEYYKTRTDLLEFKQTPLTQEAKIETLFESSEGKWNYVFNLAGETKYSQTEAVYKENIYDLSVRCARVAAKHGVDRFIEISTGQIYDAGKKPSSEDDKEKPWTNLARAKLQAEEELKKIPGLNLVIVRPAIVYGPGDMTGITPRVICAAVYQKLDQTMEFLWDSEMKINTVHVYDVCAALWHLTSHGELGQVYNLTDTNETDQGSVNHLLSELFGIKCSCWGTLKTKAAVLISMKKVAETANEKHLTPWSELCKEKGITNTPLSPYLDEEILYHNALSMDGTKITHTGFTYSHPKMDITLLKQSIQHFIDLGFFPPGLLKI